MTKGYCYRAHLLALLLLVLRSTAYGQSEDAVTIELRLNTEYEQKPLACPRQNLPPLEGQIDPIEGETEIVPGVRYVAAPGHVAVTSAGEQLLHLIDAVLHPIHLKHPDW